MGTAMKNKLYESLIIAGFGGQGIILAGKLLAQTAMDANKEVTFIPAYGAEVRGGTSNCSVVISDEPIASPIIAYPSSLIIMNKASLERFAPRLKAGGLLIYNSSLIDAGPDEGIEGDVIALPADEIAVGLGSQKSANMVALGAYIQKKGILSVESMAQSLEEVLSSRHHKSIEVNVKAMQAGADFVKAL